MSTGEPLFEVAPDALNGDPRPFGPRRRHGRWLVGGLVAALAIGTGAVLWTNRADDRSAASEGRPGQDQSNGDFGREAGPGAEVAPPGPPTTDPAPGGLAAVDPVPRDAAATDPVTTDPATTDPAATDPSDLPPQVFSAEPEALDPCRSLTGPIAPETAPLTIRTGIDVMVDGRYRVALDTGAVTEIPVKLDDDERVIDRVVRDGSTYLLVSICDRSRPTVVRQVSGGGLVWQVEPAGRATLLVGEGASWLAVGPAQEKGRWELRPPGGGAVVLLPADLEPFAVDGDRVIGFRADSSGSDPRVQVYDIGGDRVLATVAATGTIVVGGGRMVWQSASCPTGGVCPVSVLDLADGSTRAVDIWSVGSFLSAGSISTDGRYLARIDYPQILAADGQLPELTIDLVDLDTGEQSTVPGLRMSASEQPPATFRFADNGWLVIAVPDQDRVRLLLWKPGQDLPFAAGSVPGQPGTTGPQLTLRTSDR